ncbi:LysR family transcriptional regulator [Ramlibacter sp.]|uniref:LysR family transcriptional regulator n=1 Tax=Ramlibacter sp. TaxID=1917967 RepID=UPI0026051898|nr:LysR family transcriptional regulator [Ramlibacter sp.]
MDLTQLKYFLRVAELRSFSKAADALHVAQPAITRQIRLLEEELGVPLFHRHSRGSEPTEAGRLLEVRAAALLRMADQTRIDVISRAQVPTGTVRIGFPPSVGNLLIGSTVARYRAHYPDVLVSLAEGYNQVLQEWMLSDRLDVAVMTEFHSHPLLESRLLFEEGLWLLGPAGGEQRSYAIADLRQLPLIQTSHHNSLRMLLEKAAAAHGFALNIVIQAEALDVIKQLVRRGVGYHVTPYSVVGGDADGGSFSGGPVQALSISRHLVWRTDRPRTVAISEMNRMLIEQLQIAASARGALIRLAPDLQGA